MFTKLQKFNPLQCANIMGENGNFQNFRLKLQYKNGAIKHQFFLAIIYTISMYNPITKVFKIRYYFHEKLTSEVRRKRLFRVEIKIFKACADGFY